jgi:hypothetical protein
VALPPGILARGPWPLDAVEARWSASHFEPPAERTAAADAAIQALKDRDSPAHDGLSARLVGFEETPGGLCMELQPLRWALRLVEGDASGSMASLLVTRDARGTVAGGPAGAVAELVAGALGARRGRRGRRRRDPGRHAHPRAAGGVGRRGRARARGGARAPAPPARDVHRQAWLPDGAEVTPDHEHDAHAWWPADPADWPAEADEPLRRMAAMLLAAG